MSRQLPPRRRTLKLPSTLLMVRRRLPLYFSVRPGSKEGFSILRSYWPSFRGLRRGWFRGSRIHPLQLLDQERRVHERIPAVARPVHPPLLVDQHGRAQFDLFEIVEGMEAVSVREMIVGEHQRGQVAS